MENEYKVSIRRDTKMMKTFVKFSNRVNHPRVSLHLFIIGAAITGIPIIDPKGKIWGIVICYAVGIFCLLMAFFRHYIAVYKMHKNPEVHVNEELTYVFNAKGVQAYQNGELERNMGGYKKIYRVWEDEKHFFVGMNEEDLLILPKSNFEEGDAGTFRDFVLERSKATYVWQPVTISGRVHKLLAEMKAKEIEHDEKIAENKARKVEEKSKKKCNK